MDTVHERLSRVLLECARAIYLGTCRLAAVAVAAFMVTTQGLASPVSPIVLERTEFYQDLAPALRFHVDEKKALSVTDALKLTHTASFQAIDTPIVDFGFTKSRFWLWGQLLNSSDQDGTWRLAVDVPMVETVTVFLIRKTENSTSPPEKILTHHQSNPFHARGHNYRYLAANITLRAYERAEILIAYSSKHATQLPLSIESPDHFFKRVNNLNVHNLGLLGLLVGMTLVSTIYLTVFRPQTAFFYAAYISMAALYLFLTDGYAFKFLWPAWPEWNAVAIAPVGTLMAAAGTMFGKSFLDTEHHHPIINKLFIAGVTGSGILFLSSFWLLQYDWFKLPTLGFVVLCALLYLVAGIFAVRRGHAGAKFFVAGAAAIVGSILFGFTGYMNPGLIPLDLAGHTGRYALVFEGFAFALAIFLNIQGVRRERDQAMRREISLTREKLSALEMLQEARDRHQYAVELAENRRAQLATTAHDIQQPLAALRMALKNVEQVDGAAQENISGSFEYLDALIEQNLKDTRPRHLDDHHNISECGHDTFATNAQTTDVPVEKFPVSVVLNNVVRMFETEAREKGLELTYVPSQVTIETDPISLMRMTSNLVSNAVKYTSKGRILIGCRRTNGTLSIEVHDTGPGLSDKELKNVMKPYGRASNEKGTGLGLNVVRDLAEKRGLKFDVTSTQGRGSTFRISIPTHT